MIHTLTLNPAIDKLLYLDCLEKNVTNRLRDCAIAIGGKGTHVSINLRCLGEPSTAFGVCFGETGKKVCGMLRDSGVDACFIHKDGAETRTNCLLIERGGDCTILAEKGPLLTEAILDELFSKMEERVNHGDILVLSGDASNCPDPATYNRLLNRLKSKKLKVFLDTSGDSLLRCAAETPYLIKPNLDELSTLCGHPVALDEDEMISAINSLRRYEIPVVAVSLGGDGSIIKAPEGTFRVRPPKVQVANTIGCGDCFLAGFVYGVSRGLSLEQSIRAATAVSSATAESNSSVGFDVKRAEALAPLVQITKLS